MVIFFISHIIIPSQETVILSTFIVVAPSCQTFHSSNTFIYERISAKLMTIPPARATLSVK